jgi:hypothetical protein
VNCKCPNCDWSGDTSNLEPLGIELFERLEAGDTFPNGQCPECDALVCVPDPLRDAAPEMLAVLRQIVKDFNEFDEEQPSIFIERMMANCTDAECAIEKATGGAK